MIMHATIDNEPLNLSLVFIKKTKDLEFVTID